MKTINSYPHYITRLFQDYNEGLNDIYFCYTNKEPILKSDIEKILKNLKSDRKFNEKLFDKAIKFFKNHQ